MVAAWILVGCAPTAVRLPGPAGDTGQTGSEGAHGDPVDLYTFDGWTLQPAAGDPFPDHRPDPVICDGIGFHAEVGLLEVETAHCNYAVATSPLLAPVRAGDRLDLLYWHHNLASVEPAVGHAALVLEGETVWELFVDIPGEPAVYQPSWVSEVSADSGALLTYHVHNHGTNSWRLGMLTVRPLQ